MELFILIFSLGIFAETSYLTFKKATEKTAKPRGHRKVFVDTSALIDRRILAVAKTGFLSDDFIIPRSVTRELQILADGHDPAKRSRARDGLEAVNEMERVEFFNTEIYDDSELGKMLVDERLITLAKEQRGVILTCDYNLEKVATTEGIDVLNVNDLAVVLGNKFEAGDRIHLKITEHGQNANQGVGYLDDGTMVVVSGAGDRVGQEIDATYSRLLQTSTGRMIFAEVGGGNRKSRRFRKKPE